MLGLGPIAFATPWLLAALIVLPALWWLLRVTPPSPRMVRFPAVRLLRDLVVREETPARTPLWLLLLRLLAAALVIVALAQPLLNPRAALPGGGPLILVVDNGWAAGRDWPARQRLMDDLLDQAERSGRDVIVLATAPAATGEPPAPSDRLRPAEARRLVQTLQPLPWPTDRAAALEALEGLQLDHSAHAVWLSDGLDDDSAHQLALRLQRFGSAEVVVDGARQPHLLRPPAVAGRALVAEVRRPAPGGEEPVVVRALAEDGRLLARETVTFPAGATRAEARLTLPVELRNAVARLDLENETTAGATVLLDERWRRRPVGLVSGRAEGQSQPLLSDLHYLERALAPYSEVRRGDILALLERDLAVLILADIGALADSEAAAISDWVDRGGVLVRFAGPRLAQNADTLIPVRLRMGDRALGGALSWSQPAHLAPFPATSPFAGLDIPADVTVTRQVLAEPSVDLAEKTWAHLADGTPLVTAEKRGEGHVVLVHTTAGPGWSNLSLSGLFVQMLRRLTALSQGVAGEDRAAVLDPLALLDGYGRLAPPPATAFPLPGGAFAATVPGPRHPPGFYGTEEARRALNLSAHVADLRPLAGLPPGVLRTGYAARGEVALKPWLLATALALVCIDLAIALALRGLLPGRLVRRPAARATASLAAVLVLTLAAPRAEAQDRAEELARKATSETYLAYVLTGDASVDATTRAGLEGLSEVLARRTSVEAAGALGVDVEQDELAFFPLLYWAISPNQPPLSDRARARLNSFLRNGGTILFDTRDQSYGGSALAGGGPGSQRLQELVQGLDVPPLIPVPPEHVLTKAFYLLQDFPGRFDGGEVWVEAEEGQDHDGVSSVIIGSNDWAGAWAVDDSGRPLHAVIPGGERQREMAYRFGVNLVMYALTGNYKADQVHVPAILERLGQ